MKKHAIPVGEFPKWAAERHEFSHSQWTKKVGRRIKADSRTSHANTRGYRMRRARLLLAKIERNELHPSAVAGLEQDYKREFKMLRKEKQ